MTERHFRVVQLEGKKVEFGGVSITSKASPGSAARKLLTSIAHEKGLKKNKKASMPKVKFCIQEYTQGSSKKVYGPYVGHFHKYTAAELKKAATAKGKIKFTMKPVVKLAKGNMKGGKMMNDNILDKVKMAGLKNNIKTRYIIGIVYSFTGSQKGFLVGGQEIENFISSCRISDTGMCVNNLVKVLFGGKTYKLCYNQGSANNDGIELIPIELVHEPFKNASHKLINQEFLTQVPYNNGTIGNAVKINNQAGVRTRSSTTSTSNNNNKNCVLGTPGCTMTRNRSREGCVLGTPGCTMTRNRSREGRIKNEPVKKNNEPTNTSVTSRRQVVNRANW